MMTNRLICFLLMFLPGVLFSQDNAAYQIPDSMRRNADVIKRFEEYVLTIHSPAKYTCYEKHVYTINNAAAEGYASYRSSYDRFTTTSALSGRLYDRMGKELRHTKKNEWNDYSAYDGFSLLSDARYKAFEFTHAEYPFTVAFEEEQETNGTQMYPRWMPQSAPYMSVEFSRYTIVAPADYVVRYKQLNFPGEPVITQKDNIKTYTWQLKNLVAKKKELSAPPFNELVPMVLVAPSAFEVEGYKGNMSTWDQYGKFMYQLIKGRDVLPPAIKQQVHSLTDSINDTKRKISVLYQYLQQNIRYISIQLGIGGWQPFEASYVAEKKYGDCKALSNYMIALLKEAGITGKYVEIYGGKTFPAFHEDFPFSQANHVICCVPMAKDTIWLECTSQDKSPGYMGSFTGNRKAILVDESGSKIVHTPVYLAADNLQVRKVTATVDAEGNLMADINNRYTGLQQDFPHDLMYQASKEEREKYLNGMFSLPTYKVLKSVYQEKKATIPEMFETLQISCSNYATITGKRLFLNPGIFDNNEKLAPDTARQYDYLVRNAYRDIDSVDITVPAGYQVESLPKTISLDTKFGRYHCLIQVKDNVIHYYRSMEQSAIRIPAAEFNQLVAFYDQVYKSDKSRVVLVKPQ